MKAKSDSPARARREILRAIPGGRLAITDALFPGGRKLYCAVHPDGTIAAQDHTAAGLSRQVRLLRKNAA